MPGDIQLGNDYELSEDSNGNFALTHTPSGSTLSFDSANELFEFAAEAKFGGALTDTNGKMIYDPTTGTVGDGTTDANHDTVTVVTDLVDAAGVSHTGELADNDHSTLDGLSADDHIQYLLVDGTRAMSGSLDMGANDVNNAGTITASSSTIEGVGSPYAQDPHGDSAHSNGQLLNVPGYQSASRSFGTWYQNTSGGPIEVRAVVELSAAGVLGVALFVDSSTGNFNNRVEYKYLPGQDNGAALSVSAIVPDTYYYYLESYGTDTTLNSVFEQELTQ